ncbi:MAG: hypothetical protein ACLQNE_25525 [Thermoguttaceae bacterium]|jgi:hypothetical protein
MAGEGKVSIAERKGRGKTPAKCSMRIYDTRARRSVADRTVRVEESVGAEYRVFDLGVHRLSSAMYAWVAPPQRPDAVTAVYVDRIFFVRQPPPAGSK